MNNDIDIWTDAIVDYQNIFHEDDLKLDGVGYVWYKCDGKWKKLCMPEQLVDNGEGTWKLVHGNRI